MAEPSSRPAEPSRPAEAPRPAGTPRPAVAPIGGSGAGTGPPDGADAASPPGPSPRRRSGRRLRSLAAGVVAAGVLAFLLFGVIGTGGGSTSPGPVVPDGAVAPDFTLPALLGGPPVHLDALGRDRGRPVVLNFFASWCLPCRRETPLLAKTAGTLARRHSPVQFVGVDVGDTASSAKTFVEQAGVTYPVGVDADMTVAAGRYGLNGEPQTFFLDPSGHVVAHKLGALDAAEVRRDLRQITGG